MMCERSRREVLTLFDAAITLGSFPYPSIGQTTEMFGLISKIKSVADQRDALIAILVQGTSAMPGCLSYVVARDAAEADAIWITEIWESRERHQASLSLPSVQQAIAKGRPLISGFAARYETQPVGGQGLGAA
jgi:quinol monooxygenase YgiN